MNSSVAITIFLSDPSVLTETVLSLEPGTYKLQLLMGNYLHIPHDDPIYSEVITITVE